MRCALAGLGIRTRPSPVLPWVKDDGKGRMPQGPPSIVGKLVECLAMGRIRQHLILIMFSNMAQAPLARRVIAEHPGALEQLSELLGSEEQYSQYWAAQVFAVMAAGMEAEGTAPRAQEGKSSSVEELAAAEVAHEATLATGRLGLLVRMLEDPMPVPRRGAAEAIARICINNRMRELALAEGAAPLLVSVLHPEEDTFVRDHALAAIVSLARGTAEHREVPPAIPPT